MNELAYGELINAVCTLVSLGELQKVILPIDLYFNLNALGCLGQQALDFCCGT